MSSPGSPQRKDIPPVVLFDNSRTSFRELKHVSKIHLETKEEGIQVWEKAIKRRIYGSHVFVTFFLARNSDSMSKLQLVDLAGKANSSKRNSKLSKQVINHQNLGVSYFEQLFSAKSCIFGTRQSLTTNILRDVFFVNSAMLSVVCTINCANKIEDSSLLTVVECAANIEKICRRQETPVLDIEQFEANTESEEIANDYEKALQQYYKVMSQKEVSAEVEQEADQTFELALDLVKRKCSTEIYEGKKKSFDLVHELLKSMKYLVDRDTYHSIDLGLFIPKEDIEEVTDKQGAVEDSEDKSLMEESVMTVELSEETKELSTVEKFKQTLALLSQEIKELSREIKSKRNMENVEDLKSCLRVKKDTFRKVHRLYNEVISE